MNNSFYNLFKMIEDKKVRNNDLLIVHSLQDETFEEPYLVTNKDIISLINDDSLFDNFFIFDLLQNYTFKVVFKDKEKELYMKGE